MKYLIFLLVVFMHSNLEAQFSNGSDDLSFQVNNVNNSITTKNQKSEHVAFLLGLGITTMSYYGSNKVGYSDGSDYLLALMALGIFIGPNAGSLYAGDFKPLAYGLAFRSLGMLAYYSFVYMWLNDTDIPDVMDSVAFISGLVLMQGSSIYDIVVKGPRSVKRYNERISNLSLKPWMSPANGGAGITAGIRF